ncbi:lytic transglycosylase domain-containing protein [Marinibacterium sp. SX1]|uniref:lytic transglycosylase domain-containing protein n=1 Tax=Marinibacterium sp. SX1 TaxID=3388424 RepID=UPI003D164C51
MPTQSYDVSLQLRAFLKTMALALTVLPANSVEAARNNCDAAADRASRHTGVPVEVLQAVTRVETGRNRDGNVEPWPWAINVAGKGYWFDNEDAALSFAFKQVKNGARNFDVGCFQINYRWHGDAFVSIEDMFDPETNAQYAARFLVQLFEEFGDWESAAGAYHSRTKKFADRYKDRFREIRAKLDIPNGPPNTTRRRRVGAGPGSLIGDVSHGRRSPGSLVALAGGQSAFIRFD